TQRRYKKIRVAGWRITISASFSASREKRIRRSIITGEPLLCGLITRRRITTWAGYWLSTVSLPTQLPITKEPLRLILLMRKHETILVLRFLGSGVLMMRLLIIRRRSKSGRITPRPHATLR